jgi:hypothetical protein
MANVIVSEFLGASSITRIQSGYGLLNSTELDSTDTEGGDAITLGLNTRQIRLLAVAACSVSIGTPAILLPEGDEVWIGVDGGEVVTVTAPE